MKKLFAFAMIASLVCFLGCSKLVCVSDSDGRRQIYWMDLEPTPQPATQLFNTTHNDSSPNVSHDGKRVAFARGDDIKKIIVKRLNESDELPLQQSPAFAPRWSPNGSYIAYTNGAKVCWINSDGTTLPGRETCTNPLPGYIDDYGHDFLNDGTIIFSRRKSVPSIPGFEECVLWKKDLITGSEESLGHTGKNLVVSHNGQLLAYQGPNITLAPAAFHSFYIVRVPSWQVIYSATYSTAAPPPAIPYPSTYGFSDDDAQLLFSARLNTTSKYELYRMNVNGSGFAALPGSGNTYNTTMPDGFKWDWW